MKFSQKQVKEMAENIEVGHVIYINLETYEVKEIFDSDMSFEEDSYWHNELETIDKEWGDYTTIEPMRSHDAYEVMVAFLEEIKDEQFKEELTKILKRKSPFANFKWEVEGSEYREQWFKFHSNSILEYVKRMLDLEEIDYER